MYADIKPENVAADAPVGDGADAPPSQPHMPLWTLRKSKHEVIVLVVLLGMNVPTIYFAIVDKCPDIPGSTEYMWGMGIWGTFHTIANFAVGYERDGFRDAFPVLFLIGVFFQLGYIVWAIVAIILLYANSHFYLWPGSPDTCNSHVLQAMFVLLNNVVVSILVMILVAFIKRRRLTRERATGETDMDRIIEHDA